MILSSLGEHAMSAIGPARRLAHHAGWDSVEDALHPLASYKRQIKAREYATQLQSQVQSQESNDTTSEETDPHGAPGDGAETIAVDTFGGSDAATAGDPGDGSLLEGIGRAIRSVGDWISDTW